MTELYLTGFLNSAMLCLFFLDQVISTFHTGGVLWGLIAFFALLGTLQDSYRLLKQWTKRKKKKGSSNIQEAIRAKIKTVI
jgi:hypothetical protein